MRKYSVWYCPIYQTNLTHRAISVNQLLHGCFDLGIYAFNWRLRFHHVHIFQLHAEFWNRIVRFLVCKVFGAPFCCPVQRFLRDRAKVLCILQSCENLIFEVRDCMNGRFSTKVVSNVPRSISPRYFSFMFFTLSCSRLIPFSRPGVPTKPVFSSRQFHQDHLLLPFLSCCRAVLLKQLYF